MILVAKGIKSLQLPGLVRAIIRGSNRKKNHHRAYLPSLLHPSEIIGQSSRKKIIGHICSNPPGIPAALFLWKRECLFVETRQWTVLVSAFLGKTFLSFVNYLLTVLRHKRFRGVSLKCFIKSCLVRTTHPPLNKLFWEKNIRFTRRGTFWIK